MTSQRENQASSDAPPFHVGSDAPFYLVLAVISGSYLVLLAGMLVADVA